MSVATIAIKPRQTAVFLAAISLSLVLANGGVLYSRYCLGDDYLGGLVPLFDLDMEKNIPTLFQTCLILFNAMLLALIGIARRREGRDAGLWLLLAAIFVLLATDEFVAIHEHLNGPLRAMLGATGPLFFAWVIPYGVLLILLGGAYLRFVLAMPSRPRRLLVFSFIAYVSGAIGFEMLGGWYFQLHGARKDLLYGLMSTGEETLEMLGMTAFAYTLLVYIETVQKGIAIRIGAAPDETPRSESR